MSWTEVAYGALSAVLTALAPFLSYCLFRLLRKAADKVEAQVGQITDDGLREVADAAVRAAEEWARGLVKSGAEKPTGEKKFETAASVLKRLAPAIPDESARTLILSRVSALRHYGELN